MAIRAFGRRTRRSVLGLGAAVLVLSGCNAWLQPGYGPGHTNDNPGETTLTPSTVTGLSEAWSAPGLCASEPIVSGDRLYCTFSSPSSVGVKALDTRSGAIVWERSLASNPFIPWIQPVAFSGGDLWVGHITSPPGFALTVLDPATGDIVRSESTSLSATPFVTAAGRVANVEVDVSTNVQTLVVRDGSTGARLWSHAFPDPSLGATTPTLADGRIYITVGSTIEAFDANCPTSSCDPLWAQDFAATNDGPFRSPVAGPNGEVFAVANGQTADGAPKSRLFVVDGATGDSLWDKSYYGDCALFGDICLPGGITGLAVHGDTVFVSGYRDVGEVGERTESLTAYAAAGCNGSPCSQWSAPVQGPVVIGGSVAYVGHGTSVDAYDVDGCGNPTCSPLASVALPHTFSRMSVARGKLFVQTSDDTGDTLVAFSSTAA